MTPLIPAVFLALGATVPLVGSVADADGRPVAGATVWLGDTMATRKGPEVLATAETDDRGRFRLERDDDLAGRGGIWSPTLWAYKPGARLAFVEFKQALPAADEPVRLTLGPPTSAALRVVQTDGKPAAGARVRVVQTNSSAPRPPVRLTRPHLAVTTDADGRAHDRRTVARSTSSPSTVTVPAAWLDQCLTLDPGSGTVALRPLGRRKVRVVADDPKAARGWSITATTQPTEPGYRGPSTQLGPRRDGRGRPGRPAADRPGPRLLGDQAARGLELPRGEGSGDDRTRRRDGGCRDPHPPRRAGRGGPPRRPRRGADCGGEGRPRPAPGRLADGRMARHRRPGALLGPRPAGPGPLRLFDPRHARRLLPAPEDAALGRLRGQGGRGAARVLAAAPPEGSRPPGEGRRRGGQGGGRRRRQRSLDLGRIRRESELGPRPDRRPGRVRPGQHRAGGRGPRLGGVGPGGRVGAADDPEGWRGGAGHAPPEGASEGGPGRSGTRPGWSAAGGGRGPRPDPSGRPVLQRERRGVRGGEGGPHRPRRPLPDPGGGPGRQSLPRRRPGARPRSGRVEMDRPAGPVRPRPDAEALGRLARPDRPGGRLGGQGGLRGRGLPVGRRPGAEPGLHRRRRPIPPCGRPRRAGLAVRLGGGLPLQRAPDRAGRAVGRLRPPPPRRAADGPSRLAAPGRLAGGRARDRPLR